MFTRFLKDYHSGKLDDRLNRDERTHQSVFIRLTPSPHRYSFRDEL